MPVQIKIKEGSSSHFFHRQYNRLSQYIRNLQQLRNIIAINDAHIFVQKPDETIFLYKAISILVLCELRYNNCQIIMSVNQTKVKVFTLEEPNLLDLLEKYMFKRECYIGKYKIITELGGGAFARVYQGYSFQDKQKYALKIYSLSLIRAKFDEYLIEKMENYIDQQAKLIQKCNSPHVVKCFGTIQSQNYKVLVLQFCSRSTLWKHLMEKGGKFRSLAQSEAVNLIMQVSLGLIELHKNNIVHRDLKLQNIVIKNGICKIIDLGLSKQIENQSGFLFTNVGSDYTKAPQINNNKPYGCKVDIYSLGVIYLNLISECSFQKRSAHNFYNNRHVLWSDPSKISQESLDFIEKTLQVNSIKRIGWRDILQHPLFRDRKMLNESQIKLVEENFRSQLIHATVIIVDCQSYVSPPQYSKNRSSIFQQEDIAMSPPPAKSLKESFSYAVYSDQVKQRFLNCKKAEFILHELIMNIQSNDSKRMEKDMQSCHILLYLLSLQAYELISQASHYFKANFYNQFQIEVDELSEKIRIKFQFYQQILIGLLKCVKNAFIQSEILRNYEPLKHFLQFQKARAVNLNQQHLNLIVYYIQRLTGLGVFNRKAKTRLFAFRKVMMITIQDLRISCFQEKVCQIRIAYSY